MKAFKLLTVVAFALTLQACQLTEQFSSYLMKSVELNNFEKTQSVASDLCDSTLYKNLSVFFTPKLAAAIILECEEKRKQLVTPN